MGLLRRRASEEPSGGVLISRASVAMGDESEPIALDLEPDGLTVGTLLHELVGRHDGERRGWVHVGDETTTWVLFHYARGRVSGERGVPLAVLTCNPVAVTHLLAHRDTPIDPGSKLYLAYRNTEDPDSVALTPVNRR